MAVKEKIVITADDKTARAFRSVQSSAKRTGAGLAAMGRTMAKVGAVGVVAAGALFLLTKRAIENADAIAKNADAMGINVEALQEYRFAAELSGIETQKFDASLVQFTKRIGEASADTGSLIEFLKKYDETLIDAITSTKDTGEALDVTLSIMADMEKQTDRAAFAAAAFGRSGVVMTNMLRDGKVGLQEMRDEAQRLGLVLGEDTLRGVERANDAITRMTRIIGVNFQRILISSAPAIEALGDAFADAAPDILDAANALIRFFGGPQLLGIAALNDEIAEHQRHIDELIESQRELVLEGKKHTFDFDAAGANIRAEQNMIDDLAKIVADKNKAIRDAFAVLDDPAANGTTTDKTIENERKRAEVLLLAIEETHLQVMGLDAEFLDSRAAQELEKLLALYEAKTITDDEFREASLTSWSTFEERKLEIALEAAEQITAMELAENDKREKAARDLADAELRARRGLHDGLSAIAALQNVQSRKAFEIGKAAAMSLALVKTYEGAQGVFASAAQVPYIGWILAPIAAAAAIVTGLANVQAIASTSFGGGAGGRGGGGGGVSMPSVPTPDVPALAPPGNDAIVPTTVFVNFDSESGMISTEWLRDEFFPQFNEAIGDGINIVAT